LRTTSAAETKTTIAMLLISEQHDLRLLTYSERVGLAVQTMDRNPNMTRRRAASTFKVKRRSIRDRSVHKPAKATTTSALVAPNNHENNNFHALPTELICAILDNLKSAQDVVAVGQTNKTLRHVAIDHLCRNACRYNAIIWAIYAGRRTLLQLLLQRGAALVYKRCHFELALPIAATKGDEVMVKLLVDATINIYGTVSYFDSVMSEGVLRGNAHIVKLALDMCTTVGFDYTNLYFGGLVDASYKGREQIVRMLLDVGVPDNEARGRVDGALYSAASAGHEQITKLLLEAGANANAIGYVGDSALQGASSAGHDTVVRLLLEAGASTSRHRSLFYGSALQKASGGGHERVVELLLRAGARVNTPGGRSGTALQRAQRNRHMKVVKLLRDAGARENMLV
jgi:ankyrin repeat protein